MSCSREPARIRLVTFQGAEAPVIAQKLGFFQKEGLAVDLQEIAGTGKAMEALLAGSADSMVGTYEQAIQVQALGKPVLAYLQLTNCHCLALVALKNVSLKGKVIGVAAPGGQMQNFALRVLEQAGVDAKDVTFAAIGVGPAALAAVEGGRVDAAVVLANTLVPLRQRHPDLVTIAETFSPEGMRRVFGSDGYPSMALLGRPEWLHADRERTRKLVRAMRAAVNWMKTNSPEAVRQQLGAGNVEALRLHLPRYDAQGAFQLEQTRVVYDFLAKHNDSVRAAQMDPRQTFTNEFLQ